MFWSSLEGLTVVRDTFPFPRQTSGGALADPRHSPGYSPSSFAGSAVQPTASLLVGSLRLENGGHLDTAVIHLRVFL